MRSVSITSPQVWSMPSLEQAELVVEEADVEGGVVDHQFGAADELDEVAGDLGELRLVGKEVVGQAVDALGIRHLAARVEVGMEALAGELPTHQFDAADFDDAIAGAEIQAGGFGIEDDFPHRPLPSAPVRRRAAPAHRRARSPGVRRGP
jgi:hypothetical protein